MRIAVLVGGALVVGTYVWFIAVAFRRHLALGIAAILVPAACACAVIFLHLTGLPATVVTCLPHAFLLGSLAAGETVQNPIGWNFAGAALIAMGLFLAPPKIDDNQPSPAHAVISSVAAALHPQDDSLPSPVSAPRIPSGLAFRSKLPPPPGPGEPKQVAPPGIFYLVERVKTTTSNGILAASPGEQVKLLDRMPKGKLKVTVGSVDFVVTEKQVTTDLDAARDAEKRDFVARGGQL